jgi:hypothetical protein
MGSRYSPGGRGNEECMVCEDGYRVTQDRTSCDGEHAILTFSLTDPRKRHVTIVAVAPRLLLACHAWR